VQRCALSLSGEESCPLLEYPLNLPCLACNKNRKKRHTKREKRKEKGEKKREKRKKIPNAVCEECFTILNIPKDKTFMGTICQYKIHGGTLPIKNAWGQIANTKCMGTLCLGTDCQ